MTPKQQEALDALAKYGTLRGAAKALGINHTSLRDRLKRATQGKGGEPRRALLYTTKQALYQRQKCVVRSVLVAPSLFAVVNCLWPVLMMSLAKRNDIEVAGLPAAVSVMDAVMSV